MKISDNIAKEMLILKSENDLSVFTRSLLREVY